MRATSRSGSRFGQTRYIPSVRELLRRNVPFFVAIAAAGAILRVVFLHYFPAVSTDSLIYGDIAKNWLQHGVYGVTGPAGISPTYIRLPGYPAFLAFLFAIFGADHYREVLVLQLLIDLGTCLLCASIALRLLGERAAKLAFLLAALCPFLANYSAAALTETLEVFFTALALDAALRALEHPSARGWILSGVACAAAILLRPDGAILPFAIVVGLIGRALFGKDSLSRNKFLRAALVVSAISVFPLVPWAIRNWSTFHQFQPLVPRYANEEGEFVPMGFNHWMKTWIADYASVEEVYWAVSGSPLDVETLPSRAFDSPQQRADTSQLFADYNQVLHMTPALDLRFEALARERIRAHPVRSYATLPLVRILDMWLRPRTEILPSDSRWWEFNDDPKWSAVAVGLGVIGLFYCGCGLAGWLRARTLPGTGLLLLFVVLRSGFLGTLENPEPRYTLEMYPVVIVFAAAVLVWRKHNPAKA